MAEEEEQVVVTEEPAPPAEEAAAEGAGGEVPAEGGDEAPPPPAEGDDAGGGDGAAEAAAEAPAPAADAEAAELEAAAVRIQAAARGRAVREQLSPRSQQLQQAEEEEGGGFMEYVESIHKDGLGDIAKAYEKVCESAQRKPSYLVLMSLKVSAEEGRDTWHIEAPGNHKLAFTSRLTDADMFIFAEPAPQAFKPPARYLLRLDLSYNHLTSAGAQTLAAWLSRAGPTSRLEALSLRSNSIGAEGCAAVCQAVAGRRALRSLDFSHNPLGREGGMSVVELLRRSPGLLELNIQDTESDIDVLVAVSEALLSNESQLQVCNLENPRIITLQEDHTVHLGRMLRVNTRLREMYLGKVKMRDEGVRQLVSFLLENKTLRVLDLRCNELGADGARHLGTLLGDDCQISGLNLSCNRIGEKDNVDGAKAIADALLTNRMLQHLDLNGNSLSGIALKVLGDAIDQNSTLETLALFHNHWDQPSSYRFHQIFNDRARVLPLRADFITSEQELRIDICKVDDLYAN